MTVLQREVTAKVIAKWRTGKHYRATHNGERVTLASLYRRGALDRRAWRGNDGEADAAYEYRPSNDLLTELARDTPGSIATMMSLNAEQRALVKSLPRLGQHIVTADAITDEQIRAERRAHPELLDLLMVAIHSKDQELRSLARASFADMISARAKATAAQSRYDEQPTADEQAWGREHLTGWTS